MGTYLNKRAPVQDCPQPDGREISLDAMMTRAQYRAARRAHRDACHAAALNAEDRAYGYGSAASYHVMRDILRTAEALPSSKRAGLSWWQCLRDRRHCVLRSIARVKQAESLWPEVAGDPRGEAMLSSSIARHRRTVRAYLKPLKEGYPSCQN